MELKKNNNVLRIINLIYKADKKNDIILKV